MQKEYFAIGTKRVRSTLAWLLIAFFIAIDSNIIVMAKQTIDSQEVDIYNNTPLPPRQVSQSNPPLRSYVPGEILLKFRDGITKETQDKLFNQWGFTIKDEIPQIKVKKITVPEEAEEALAQALSNNPNIEYAEVNGYYSATLTPNDPSYPNQWHHPKISSPAGWDLHTGSANAIIAIIDSGVSPTHQDLASKLVPGYNFVNNNTDTSDQQGHGTATAGTAGAITNNSLGVAGVAWENKIMPIVVLGPDNFGTWDNIAKGITYAADNGAKILNLSIVGSSFSSSVQNAINYAWGKNIVIIVAAGNNNTSTFVYPAAMNNAVAVSATNSSDNKASFSSYGDWIDISAPGENILTTNRSGSYSSWSGTSFSSPISAGIAGLISSLNPALTNAQIVDILKVNSDDIGTPGFDQYFGWGRVNVQKALSATSTPPPADTTTPLTSITSPTNGSTLTGSITVTVSATDNNAVTKVELYKDNVLYGTDLTSPYSFIWNTANDPNGSHTLYSKAYDSANNVGTSAITTVTVSNVSDTILPTVIITAPIANSSLPSTGKITITTQASDNIGVVQIDIFFDGKLLTSCYNINICSKNFTVNKTSKGSHIISVSAYDAVQNKGTAQITVFK